jgi:hypothetical protein
LESIGDDAYGDDREHPSRWLWLEEGYDYDIEDLEK